MQVVGTALFIGLVFVWYFAVGAPQQRERERQENAAASAQVEPAGAVSLGIGGSATDPKEVGHR